MAEAQHEVWIGADQAVVFAALTTVDGLNGWWGPCLEASTEVGGHVVFDHGLESPMRMKILAFAPPARVTWRFVSTYDDPDNPASEWTGQTFDWEVAPRRERTLIGHRLDVAVLRLTNAGWPEAARWQGFCTSGWGSTLDGKLKPFCESGSTSSGMVGG